MTGPGPVGVLPVDKPVGPTSHDVVAMARRGLRTRRVGHTGTLDPFASGLLLLCVGPATRLSPYLTHLDKEYEAEALLGVRTDTLDLEGTVLGVEEGAEAVSGAALEDAIEALRGEQLQVPPAFSAKKVKGEAAHRRARRGEVVSLPPVTVTVAALELTHRDGPRIGLRVRCSSGTYIRAIARDLGEALGVGAHLTALRRTSVGDFSVDDAISAEGLDAVAPDAWLSAAEAFRTAGLPWFEVEPGAATQLAMGRRIPAGEVNGALDRPTGAIENGRLLAIGEVTERGFQPRKVFVES